MLSLLHCSSIANAAALHTLGGTSVFPVMAQLPLWWHSCKPLNQQQGPQLLHAQHGCMEANPKEVQAKAKPLHLNTSLGLNPAGCQEIELPLLLTQVCWPSEAHSGHLSHRLTKMEPMQDSMTASQNTTEENVLLTSSLSYILQLTR